MLGDDRIAEKFADFFGLTCSMKQDNNEKIQRDRTLMQKKNLQDILVCSVTMKVW